MMNDEGQMDPSVDPTAAPVADEPAEVAADEVVADEAAAEEVAPEAQA